MVQQIQYKLLVRGFAIILIDDLINLRDSTATVWLNSGKGTGLSPDGGFYTSCGR